MKLQERLLRVYVKSEKMGLVRYVPAFLVYFRDSKAFMHGAACGSRHVRLLCKKAALRCISGS